MAGGKPALHAVIASMLILSGVASASLGTEARGRDAGEIAQMVDATRIMSIVEDLQAFGSREFHLESASEAADYIFSGFEEMGLGVEFQEFTVGSVPVKNVVAIIPGEGDGWFLFGAHYDSENMFADSLSEAEDLPAPGADDDASGVAVLMEMARILALVDTGRAVKFVAFGAEEYGYDNTGGLRGSEHFVAQETAKDVEYEGSAILDMVGYRTTDASKGSLITDADSYEFAHVCVQTASDYAIDIEFQVIDSPTSISSDQASFWSAGIPSILVTEELCQVTGEPINPHYHTADDTADRLSGKQMEAVAQTLLIGFVLTAEEGDSSSVLLLGLAAVTICAAAVIALFASRRRRGEYRK